MASVEPLVAAGPPSSIVRTRAGAVRGLCELRDMAGAIAARNVALVTRQAS